jgi:hypothetical protein
VRPFLPCGLDRQARFGKKRLMPKLASGVPFRK